MSNTLSTAQRALATHLIDIAMEPFASWGAESLPSLNPFTGDLEEGEYAYTNAIAETIHHAVAIGGSEDEMIARVTDSLADFSKHLMKARAQIAQSHYVPGISDEERTKVVQFAGDN